MKKSKISFESLVIGETEAYFVLNKPPFVSSLDDRHEANSIIQLTKSYNDDYQVCHRLDKETSGIIIIAKNATAYRHLSMQFEHRTVDKIYHAVVDGLHEFKDIQVDMPLRTTSRGKVVIDFEKGKTSQTKIKTVKLYKRHTLIHCKPLTGRMHQIRVHAQYLKAPLAGDIIYGGEPVFLSQLKKKFNLKKDTEERPIMQRVALHAAEVSFQDLSGEMCNFVAPYPKDLSVLIKQLEKNI